jgi:exonuclease VII large subunit
MDYGIKISKQGSNVLDNDKEHSPQASTLPVLPHLLMHLAVPYLEGAKKQLERYQIAALTLKVRPVVSVGECLHEVSSLFEDLSTISKYAEKCNHKNNKHQLWFDVRNYIRHNAREEFDKEDSSLKNLRAKRLELNPKLQLNIGFALDSIKVGGKIINLQEVKEYLDWAEDIIHATLVEAQKKGYV